VLLYILVFLIVSFTAIFFFCLGARLARPTYGGKIRIRETPEGAIRFDLELAGDPENLVTEHHVTFLIEAPNYEELLSR
jgi:hypothetical protein